MQALSAKDRLYYESYIKQADDTLALILANYGVKHLHKECGVICKINEIERLLETLQFGGMKNGNLSA